ncbi:MAG: flippase, partial [Methanomicrobiales archaeon]|nr:flippase [Methanomicrobiales archaeon]MDI6877450.1 flippase [Methanomicrobiales archaeon]
SRVMGLGAVQRQSLITLASTIALTIIGFVATFYFAHVLGPSILGAYFLFLAYLGIFDLIGDGGFGGAAVKRISEGKDQSAFFTAYVFLRVLLIAGSVLLLLALQDRFVDLQESGMFFWLIAALIVGIFSSSIGRGIYGTGKVGVYQVSNLLGNVIKVLVQILAVFLGYGLAGLAGGFIAGVIVGGAINFRFLDLRLARFDLGHLKSLFSFSFWSFLAASGTLVYTYSDTILIGYFLGNADVGIYRTAFQLTSIATFTTIALQTVLFPKISGWGTDGNLRIVETAMARSFSYALILAIPVAVGGWLLGDRLLFYLYGEPFVTGAPALAVLLAVQIVNVFMYLLTSSISALDQPRESFKVTAAAATANILINIALIPLVGIVGAAIATLATMLLNAALAYRVLSRLIRVRLERRPVLNICIAALVMAAAVGILRFIVPPDSVVTLFLTVLLGGVVYTLVLLRLDRAFLEDFREIVVQLGIPWPWWLDR